MNQKRLHIAYVNYKFPFLATTFIYREMIELQQRGHTISSFAVRRPDLNELSEESKHLVDETSYVFPMQIIRFLNSQLYYLLKKPIKYFHLLFMLLCGYHKRFFHDRIHTLFQFFAGAYIGREILKKGVKCVHSHFATNTATIGLTAAKLNGLPFSFTAHAYDIFSEKNLLNIKLAEAKFIVAISEYNKRHLCDIFPQINPDKIKVIYSGVDTSYFSRSKSQSSNNKFKMISIGRYEKQKGYQYLIKACQLLMNRGIDLVCNIYGMGSEYDELSKLIQQCRLTNIVFLKGPAYQEEIKKILISGNVFVLPCIRAENGDMDGIPVALMEAMAMEVPVISTNISGIPELIENNVSGLLVAPNNAEELAKAILLLIENEGLRKTLGRNGRKKVVEMFDIKKNIDKLENIFYNQLNSFLD